MEIIQRILKALWELLFPPKPEPEPFVIPEFTNPETAKGLGKKRPGGNGNDIPDSRARWKYQMVTDHHGMSGDNWRSNWVFPSEANELFGATEKNSECRFLFWDGRIITMPVLDLDEGREAHEPRPGLNTCPSGDLWFGKDGDDYVHPTGPIVCQLLVKGKQVMQFVVMDPAAHHGRNRKHFLYEWEAMQQRG